MIKMKPVERKMWANAHYNKLFLDLTCRVGAFNRNKLLDGLEKRLRKKRRER